MEHVEPARRPWDGLMPRKANSAAEDPQEARSEAERAVVDAFRRILRELRVSANTTQSALGISPAQLYVLRHLAEKDGASISGLAKETLTDRSSVADVVDRLVERGLAERSAHPADRRRASVRITPSGARLIKGAAPAPTDLLVSALQTLPDHEVSGLARSLGELVGAMGLSSSPANMLFEERGKAAPAARRRRARGS
jgi:MarR family transcriptional regulator, lower aerobic nicotinate degradation pathway regulator